MTSEDLEDLAAIDPQYPELSFVLKQFSWSKYARVFDLLHRAENIYCDISFLHTRNALAFIRDDLGANRLLFGTGFKSHVAAAIAGLSHAGITQAEKDAVAYDNFMYSRKRNRRSDHYFKGGYGTFQSITAKIFWMNFSREAISVALSCARNTWVYPSKSPAISQSGTMPTSTTCTFSSTAGKVSVPLQSRSQPAPKITLMPPSLSVTPEAAPKADGNAKGSLRIRKLPTAYLNSVVLSTPKSAGRTL